MSNDNPVQKPFDAVANGPVVVVTGEMGVGLSMSPEAAVESAEAMTRAAEDARRNRDAGVEAE